MIQAKDRQPHLLGRRSSGALAFAALLLISLWLAFSSHAAAQSSTTTCFGDPATIVGTSGANVLTGTNGADVIVGLGGNDKIDGRGGNDLICGGAGNDSIEGGAGDDRISGGDGADSIKGGDGEDRIFGGAGNDALAGNDGNDLLFGEGGSDQMLGGAGVDNCFVESSGDSTSSCETNLPPNEAPIAGADGPYSVNEDGGPLSVAAPGVLTNDSDPDGPPPITAVPGTDPAHSSSFALHPNGSFSYSPAADYCGPDSFTYTAKDGLNAVSVQATASIDVVCVNDAPSFTKGADEILNEDAVAQTVESWATSVSAGPANESGQSLTFNVTGNTNSSLFSAGPAVSPTGVLTYTPAANAFGSSDITITLSDNGGTANGGVDTSGSQTFTITVNPVNDAPSYTKGPDLMVFEDSGAQTGDPWATALSVGPVNEAGQTLTFNVTGNTNPSLFSAGPAVSPAGVLTYTPAANAFGAADITITLSDNGGTANGGVDTSAPQTFTITVTAVNDAPSFTKGPDATTNEDSGTRTEDPWATGLSQGPGESGQTLTFNVTGNTNSSLFSAGPAVSPTGVLTYTPAADAFGSSDITITLSDNGGTANGGVDISGSQTFTIFVNPVNDAPSFTKGPDQTVDENSGPHTVNPWATGILAGPANESGQTLTFNVTGNTNASLFSAGPAVSPTGVLTYTLAPNQDGSATITLTLSDDGGTADGGVDTSAPQTFIITVSPLNSAPVNNLPSSPSVNEDAVHTLSGSAKISISDPDAGSDDVKVTLTATNATLTLDGTTGLSFTGGADGTASMAFTGIITDINSALDGMTFTPTPDYFGAASIQILTDDLGNNGAGGAQSDTDTLDITVNPVNDAPSFAKGPDQTVDENSGPHTVNPWATVISAGPANEAGQTLTFNVTGNTNASLFSAGPAASPTGVLTYTLAPNQDGSANITITLSDNGGTANGGVDTSAPQTFTIGVNALNSPPVNNLPTAPSVNEDAVLTMSSAGALSISDPDAGTDEVEVTLTATNGTITLDGTSGLSFTVGTGSADTTMTFTGSIAGINAALDGMTFTPTPDYFGAASIQIVTDDLGNNGAGGAQSDTDTLDITVNPVNDAPSFTKGPDESVDENSGGHTVNPWATAISAGPANEAGQTLTFTVTGNTNASLFSAGPAISPVGVLTYTLNPNVGGSANITITLSDNGGTVNGGVDTSPPQTFTITVNALNDPPVNNMPASATILEDTVLTMNTPGAISISDTDAGTNSVKVTLESTNGTMNLDGTTGLSFTSGANGTATMAFTGTIADINAALDGMTFTPTPNFFGTGTIQITTDDQGFTGAGGAQSDTDTLNINVTTVNDTPSFTKGPDQTFDEDSGAHTVNPWASAISAGPGESGQTLTFNVTGNTNAALFSSGPAVSSAGALSFTSAPNAFGTATITLTLSDNGGTANSGVDTSAPQTFVITINSVNDAPTAVADSFDAIGNTGLFVGTAKPVGDAGKVLITGSVLTNDTDIDSPLGNLVAEAVTDASTTLGGTITIESDGNFTYHPDDIDTGVTDTFTYRVCDASPCNSGTNANATGTLSLPIAGQVWYVRNNQAAGGDGTSDTPFDTLVEAETASQTGDTVYVFDGTNTTTNLDTGYVMEASERLIGETRPLNIDLDGPGGNPAVPLFDGNAANVPTLTASNEDVVSLANGTLVDGFTLDPSGNGGGIGGGIGAGGGAAGDVTVAHVGVTDTGTAGTQPGIHLDGTTGTNRFSDISVTNGGSPTAFGVHLNNAGTVNFAALGTVTIATTGARALDAAATNMTTSTFDDIVVSDSGNGAIRLANLTGQTVLGDGAGTDLMLETTSGATAALDVSISANVQVGGAGTDTIVANGGPAVDIRNTSGSTFDFDTLSSTNSAGDGINLETNLSTQFTAPTGAINGAAGIAVDVDGGGAGGFVVSYGGDINDGSGQTAEITGRDGGSVTLSGDIGDSGDAGGGIVVSGNSGGTTTFSGTPKVINTGAADAVLMSSNAPGTSLVFSGGGLDIDATSGRGLEATPNGGTIEVSGTGNSITTGTGRALNISSTTIAANNVNFQSIAANGASNGIVLNTTGASGRLIVTGTASANPCTSANTSGCTGGQIANLTGGDDGGSIPTGTGIVLNNTLNPSFTRMWIHDASNYGVRGTAVAGFTMADSVINGSNGTSALTAHKDGSARFEGLTGTVNMTNVAISGGYFTNLMVDNTAGVLNGTFDNVDSGTLNSIGGDDAVQFEGIGTSDMNVDFKNGSITTASGDLFQYIGDGTGGGDLDFTNNTLTNNEPSINTGGGGVALVAGAKGAATMDVLNNSMRDSLTNALTIIKSADAAAGTNNLVANIDNNDIGVAATANSGSAEGDGMEITTFGDGNATFNITNNDVRQYNSSGIQFVAGSGVVNSGQFNLNISGNAIGNPGTNPSITLLQGIRVDSGVAAGDTFSTCVKFGQNSITGSSDAANKDFRLVAGQSTTIRQPGYGGGATDGPAFAAFAAGLIAGGAQGTATADASGTFTGSGTTCP